LATSETVDKLPVLIEFFATSWRGPKGEEVGCEGEVDLAEVRCRAEGVPAEGGGLLSVDRGRATAGPVRAASPRSRQRTL